MTGRGMVVAIYTRDDGVFFAAADSLETVQAAIASQIPIECFWFSHEGRRYTERFVFYDEPRLVRTERQIGRA